MLVDTDVMIWYFRGNAKAKKALSALGSFRISSVVYMELMQGMRNKKELTLFKRYLANTGIESLAINEDINARAMYLLEEYALGHGLKMADALIAATADHYGEALLTGSYVHYKMLPNLELKRFSP